jgi:hypothetical protein
MPSSSSSLSLLVVTAAPVAVVVIRSGAGSRHDPSQSDPAQLGPGTRPRGLVAAVLARVGFEVRGRGGARGPDGQVADADLAGRDGRRMADAGGLCAAGRELVVQCQSFARVVERCRRTSDDCARTFGKGAERSGAGSSGCERRRHLFHLELAVVLTRFGRSVPPF